MDLLLTGTRFNKQKYASDFAAFKPKEQQAQASTSASAAAGEEEPRKKKRRKLAQNEDTEDEPEQELDFATLLRRHKIKLTGLDLPAPVVSFAELVRPPPSTSGGTQSYLPCPERVLDNLAQEGILDPTPVQMASLSAMLARRDVLGCAPTGSGKTLAFALPLLLLHPPRHSAAASAELDAAAKAKQKKRHKKARASGVSTESGDTPQHVGEQQHDEVARPAAVILEPTRELALQVLAQLRSATKGCDWKIAVLGGESHVEDADAEGENVQVKASEADILIATPLRLIYAVREGKVDLAQTQHVVMDEADQLFSLNFVEQTDEVLAACTHKDVRKAMFSATVPSTLEEMAAKIMSASGEGHIRIIIGHKDAATETIDQTLQFVNTEDHKLTTLRSLVAAGQFVPPVLVFVQSVRRAKELSAALAFDGVHADSIHADKTATERDRVVRDFKDGKVWCLVSTDVFARGIDVKGINLVILYDFPQSAASYIHRIGRTGRAGSKGKAITFFTRDDAPYLKSIVNVMRLSGCQVPEWMLSLPNPSQNDKRRLKLRPIERKDVSRTSGAGLVPGVRRAGHSTSNKVRVLGGVKRPRSSGDMRDRDRRVDGGGKGAGKDKTEPKRQKPRAKKNISLQE